MLTSNAWTAPESRTMQDHVFRLHDATKMLTLELSSYPLAVLDALEAKPWAHHRVGRMGERIKPVPVDHFVRAAFPIGVKSSADTIRRLLLVADPWAPATAAARAIVALDRIMKEDVRD